MSWLRKNWFALALMVCIIAAPLSAWDAHRQSNAASIERAVQTCERNNPRNAYLQIRAEEFPKSIVTGPSFTTKVAPVVYAVMDCPATVESGSPVVVPAATTSEYMRLFRLCRVPTLRGGQIVGSRPFEDYFKASDARVKEVC